MAIAHKIILTEVSGGNLVPVTTGTYYLRVDPFSSNTYTGTHEGNGVWTFGTVADGVYQLWNASAQVASWGERWIGDKTPTFSSVTMSGNIAMGGNKVTGAGAATGTGELVRWDEAVRTSGDQTGIAGTKTTTGQWAFTTLCPRSSVDPTSIYDLTRKDYVDGLFSGVVTPPQSGYVIQCIPGRTADTYSKTTMEACHTYLATLSNITTYRGVIIVNPLEATNCSINVDDGTNQWVSNGIDIIGYNKPRITRQAPNNSLTSNSRLRNIVLYDQIAATRGYTNFTFDDCDFYFDGSGNSLSFTSCKFLGINRLYAPGTDINLTNCTGTALWTNATATIAGTTPIDLRLELDANDLGVPV